MPDRRPILARYDDMCATVAILLGKNRHDPDILRELNMNGIRMARLAWLLLEEEHERHAI